MKLINTILILLITSTTSFSISRYFENDTLYVWAKGGLKLRNDDDFNSTILDTLTFGDSIIALEGKYLPWNDFYIDDNVKLMHNESKGAIYYKKIKLKGSWVRVRYKNIVFYVFDAYLSKMKIPKMSNKYYALNSFKFFTDYLKEYTKLKGDSHDSTISKYVFKDELYIKEYIDDNKGSTTVIFFNLSFEELYLLIAYQQKYVFGLDVKQYIKKSGRFSELRKIEVGLECGSFQFYEIDNTAVFEIWEGC